MIKFWNKWKNKPTQILGFFKQYKLPLLSGGLLGLASFPVFMPLGFFALVPLWLFITQQKKIKSAIIGSLISQLVFTFIVFNWIIYTAHHFGNLNWILSACVLILYCFSHNLFITLGGSAWFFIHKKSMLPMEVKLLLFPLLFSLFHTLIPSLFPWNIGYIWLWVDLPVAQTAELWGFRFLNTLFYIFNLLSLIFYKHRWNSSTGKKAVLGFVSLFLFLNILGAYLKARIPKPDSSFKALIVQPNIGSQKDIKTIKPFKNYMDKALYLTKDITVKSILRNYKKNKDIQFILWPESSYPYIVHHKRIYLKGVSGLVRKLKTPLITGAMTKSSRGYHNSLLALDKKGRIMKPIYSKMKLVVFGETTPGINIFPSVKKLLPYFYTDLIPGLDFQVKNINGVNLGFQICYESLFDNFSRMLALKKAHAIVNVTNDSWYGSWQEPFLHLTVAQGRTIEVRKPFVRATNTGISAVIHFDGSLDALSPINKSWFHLYKIPYHKKEIKTLFMSWGFYINEIFLFFLVLPFLFFQWRLIRKK